MSTTQETKARNAIVKQWTRLLINLKQSIADEYRASDEDTLPGMQVTFGLGEDQDGELAWSYQTGDNSFTGGAYGFSAWGVVSLYRRSNCLELAEAAFDEASEALDGSKWLAASTEHDATYGN
jgi:hypothetical protein